MDQQTAANQYVAQQREFHANDAAQWRGRAVFFETQLIEAAKQIDSLKNEIIELKKPKRDRNVKPVTARPGPAEV